MRLSYGQDHYHSDKPMTYSSHYIDFDPATSEVEKLLKTFEDEDADGGRFYHHKDFTLYYFEGHAIISDNNHNEIVDIKASPYAKFLFSTILTALPSILLETKRRTK